MNCYFCHKALKRETDFLYTCDSHNLKGTKIGYILGPSYYPNESYYIYFMLIDKKNLEHSFKFYILPNAYQLSIILAHKEEFTIYKGSLPENFLPETAMTFVNRLLNLKAFL